MLWCATLLLRNKFCLLFICSSLRNVCSWRSHIVRHLIHFKFVCGHCTCSMLSTLNIHSICGSRYLNMFIVVVTLLFTTLFGLSMPSQVVTWKKWRWRKDYYYCLCQVNGVNGGDTVFVHYVPVCVSVCSGLVNQSSLKRLKLWTSNLTCMFPGTVRTWPLKYFSKRGVGKNSLGGDMLSHEHLIVSNIFNTEGCTWHISNGCQWLEASRFLDK